MTKVTVATTITVSPVRIWATLIELDRYEEWESGYCRADHHTPGRRRRHSRWRTPVAPLVGRRGSQCLCCHIAGQRSGWEPSWEPFGVDRGGRA
jgi:hypothetical protein